jgi:hypothetical protein
MAKTEHYHNRPTPDLQGTLSNQPSATNPFPNLIGTCKRRVATDRILPTVLVWVASTPLNRAAFVPPDPAGAGPIYYYIIAVFIVNNKMSPEVIGWP